VLSGAFTAAVDVGQGDVVQAHFDRLGSVTAKFV
jgi:2-keto-4-pentenoate hydratase